MSGLYLGPLNRAHLGAIETPEYRPLPWDKGNPAAKKKAARLEGLSTVRNVVLILAGSVGLYISLRGLRLAQGKK